MGVSFKVSKKGARFRPKPKPDLPSVQQDEDADACSQINKNQIVVSNPKPSVCMPFRN